MPRPCRLAVYNVLLAPKASQPLRASIAACAGSDQRLRFHPPRECRRCAFRGAGHHHLQRECSRRRRPLATSAHPPLPTDQRFDYKIMRQTRHSQHAMCREAARRRGRGRAGLRGLCLSKELVSGALEKWPKISAGASPWAHKTPLRAPRAGSPLTPFPPRSLQGEEHLEHFKGSRRLQTACAARRVRNSYTLGERLLRFGRLLSYCLGAISCECRRFSYLLGLLISYFLGESSYTLGAAS